MQNLSFPDFDRAVPDSGYQWWYVDGTSSDGQHHLVVIAFVGSVFSPYYFRAINNGRGEAEQYCALNVGIYSRGQQRWVLNEYNRTQIARDSRRLGLGSSALHFDGDALNITVDERAVPLPRRVRGRIRVIPTTRTPSPFTLHERGQQTWWPFAPSARVELDLSAPSLRWSGQGYFDTNSGAIPLQDCFTDWHWSRRHDQDGTHITYQTHDCDQTTSQLALRIVNDGSVEHGELPRVRQLPKGLWRMTRPIATDTQPRLVQSLEDTPFYTRSVVATPDAGASLTMHESLSMERFVQPWVQRLLPFRTRR